MTRNHLVYMADGWVAGGALSPETGPFAQSAPKNVALRPRIQARPLGYAPSAARAGSIKQPSETNGRSGEIRTPDPLLPKQVRYQAALRSARPSFRPNVNETRAAKARREAAL